MNLLVGKTAGLIALTLASDVNDVVAYDELTAGMSKGLGYPTRSTIKDITPRNTLCVHGREFVPYTSEHLCINVHPFLYKYKGASPVKRAIEDGCTRGSVGAHIMTSELDCGKVLSERYTNVLLNNQEGVYKQLYPLYTAVILDVINHLSLEFPEVLQQGI